MLFNTTSTIISWQSVLLVEGNGVRYQKTTDLSHNHYDDIINVVSCFLCDSANGRTWEMFLFKKKNPEGFSYYLSTKSAFLPVVTAPLVTSSAFSFGTVHILYAIFYIVYIGFKRLTGNKMLR